MITKGRNCDDCGHYLSEEEFDKYGSWDYTCKKCDFKYKHGVTKLGGNGNN